MVEYQIWEAKTDWAEYKLRKMLDIEKYNGWSIKHIIVWNDNHIKLLLERPFR